MIPYATYCDYEASNVQPICCGCGLRLNSEEKLKRGITLKTIEKMPACDVCFEMFAVICKQQYWLILEVKAQHEARERKAQYERLKFGGDYFA